MSDQLLATKLYIPPARANLVTRARLVERLELASSGKLTLISAPAGYGKTTLLSDWASSTGRLVAWVSLDEADNETSRFFTYLIAAMQTLEPDFGEEIFTLLQTQKAPINESILMSLVNDLSSVENPFSLLLDDYHVIESAVVDDAVHFLLDYLPPQMNLVISGRADPNFPLSRLRASGELTELRAADLRFTQEEIGAFLNEVMGLALQPRDLQALGNRTEGWIASLQLAAISLRNREDKAAFVAAFSGSHHYVIDYLIDEVIARLPEEMQTFLLRTCILERFTAAVCDSVVGAGNGQSVLQQLEEANLFLIPLDDQRQWYRYHHLFADSLAHLLVEREADEIPTLHRRAAAWFKEQGLELEAIEHALQGEDYPFAAQLVEKLGPQLMMHNEFDLLSRWLDSIPEPFVESWPWLCIIRAWMCHRWAQMDAVVNYLNHAEAVVLEEDPEEKKESTRIVLGQVHTIRALMPLGYTDVPRIVQDAKRALDLLPNEYFNRGAAALALGNIHREQGQFTESLRLLHENYQASLRVNNRILAQYLIYDIGQTYLRQGKLQAAAEAMREAIGLKYLQTNIEIPYAGTARIALADILRLWNDLDEAEAAVQQGIAVAEENQVIDAVVRGHLMLARLLITRGDLEAAAAELNEAQRIAEGLPGLNDGTHNELIAVRARLHLAEGMAPQALEFLARHGYSPDRAGEAAPNECWIALGESLLQAGRDDAGDKKLVSAQSLVEGMLETSRSMGFVLLAIRTMVLLAMIQETQGQDADAGKKLSDALQLAAPENMVRVFLDGGEAIKRMLPAVSGTAGEFALIIRRAFDAPFEPRPPSKDLPLLDPLSERELEVLHLLSTELTGPEIAQELVISLNTLRTHTKRIYSKLGVNSRRAALRRAEELSL